ncbi:aldehyde dehydrogenase (NAD+) [Herbinix hemicellulosilytica]|uniref:Aldehyde dehydrogenase n=1 Tax=Herbinix hemicellulosilytica TaxID=1564487 RepID=A0A0H5SHH7_HERHM|nr:aldehyde dehydrogenase [Herbinix hemicellulosilytica]RBP58826.1 aldehyde dehydrogenase (NAD+) [Herbinix hemicellulosilytica]CRZ34967.1 putative aldehyde dehydrogenase YwdH [Herbinix hemicellulosilytica]
MIGKIVEEQRKFYLTGKTLDYKFRMKALSRLRNAIIHYEEDIYDALAKDLNKSKTETYLCEIGIVLDEIRYHQRNLHRWMKKRVIMPSIGQLPGRCYSLPEPYGVTLIMAPWNYPINLCFAPLIGAISAGNTAVLKPSAYAPETSKVIEKIISEAFPPYYITVVSGGRKENALLLGQKFDYIFFTGSPTVGRVVMEAAAKNLTPVTLELGGKSPVIVDETANIRLAAKRIAFGKVTNAGQTCVAPDYLLIHSKVKDKFIIEYKRALQKFFPDNDMSRMVTIISEKHYERLKNLLTDGRIILGGQFDDERLFIEPTLIDGVGLSAPIMKEEIFGPILPIITYDNLDECIEVIRSLPKPLALYIFSENRKNIRKVLNTCSFGGGCINDTILHLANPRLPFGGVGESGMGSYHGKKSFETFTHYRSVFKQSSKIDIPIRYMPYTEKKLRLLKNILR